MGGGVAGNVEEISVGKMAQRVKVFFSSSSEPNDE